MNKKKQLATCLVLSMSLTMAAPVWAADTTAPAQTAAAAATTTQVKPNTFTLADIQKLAVQKNPSVQKVNISLKLAENSLSMAGNDLRDVENSMQNIGYSSADTSKVREQIAGLQAQIAKIKAEDGWESDATKAATVALLNSQIASLQASLGSASGSMESSFEALLAQRQSAESKVDTAENNKKDAERSKEELAIQMRYTAAQMVTQEQQLEQSIELLQKQYDLAIKQQDLAKLQKELGLVTELDSTNSYISASQAAAQLNQAKDNLKNIKRAINVMIGRSADAELNIAPVEMPTVISTTPAYNDQLVKSIKSKSYSLKTLQRDINDYRDQADDLRNSGSIASDTFEAIDYQIELKKLEMKNTENDLADTVKSAIDNVRTTGETYRNSQLAYSAAQTTYDQTKLKYDLGMISALEMQAAEATLLKSAADNNAAAYAHYLANLKYQALTQGVTIQ